MYMYSALALTRHRKTRHCYIQSQMYIYTQIFSMRLTHHETKLSNYSFELTSIMVIAQNSTLLQELHTRHLKFKLF